MLCIILFVAYFKTRFIETSLTIVLFFNYRRLFEKQYHASSLYLCSLISVIVFIIIVGFETSLSFSIFISITLTFTLTCISYIIKDYIDKKLFYMRLYRETEVKQALPLLENLGLQEICELLPNLKYSTIKLVYDYLHRDTEMTAIEFADNNNVSEQLIYKYLKQVKTAYEGLK